MDSFDKSELCTREITLDDISAFKQSIIYVGKGRNRRKLSHLSNTAKLSAGNLRGKIYMHYRDILDVWNSGHGIIALQICSNSEHYLSLCKETSMIRSIGNDLCNSRDGSCYGVMKSWTPEQIFNFGEILLYFAFEQCLKERPSEYFLEDFTIKKQEKVYEPKKYNLASNFELNGVLDLFLYL